MNGTITRIKSVTAALLLAMGCASAAWAQTPQPQAKPETQPKTQSEPAEPKSESKLQATGKRAGEIVSQPAKDVGVSRTEIPEVLQKAADDPYDLDGTKTCKQLAASIKDLNEALGPDFAIGGPKKENRAGKLAEVGGQTVINSLIPFRGLVREITGAAPAQRRLNAAIDAGFARRGFLRGMHHNRGCKTSF